MPDASPLVVVQNNHVVRLTAPLALAARARGVALHDVSSGDMAGVPATPEGGPWGPVLVVGSVLFVHQWARGDAGLSRWVFWDDARYDAALWAEELGRAFLNADGRATTAGTFAASPLGAMHVRPRSGVKLVGDEEPSESRSGRRSIPGLVATPHEFAALGVDPGTPVWLSPPSAIDAEVRVWMIGGAPAAASTYRVGGEHRRDARHALVAPAVERARELHETWHPGRHYVVDLGLVDGAWRVVEYNPIHSSGWYDADPGAVLEAFMAAETATP